MSRNFLSMNEDLLKGDFLLSNNREYKAVFQDDGNFVVYGWKPLWASNTAGKTDANQLVMQNDCNLVIYTPSGPVWASNTYFPGVNLSRLTLGNDGILTINNRGKELWKSTKN